MKTRIALAAGNLATGFVGLARHTPFAAISFFIAGALIMTVLVDWVER